MDIYSLHTNLKKTQLLLPANLTGEKYEMLMFDGMPKIDNWIPTEFYIDNPLIEPSHFFSLIGSSAFVCDEVALSKFSYFFNSGIELLPIYLENHVQLYILNVIDCVNALDQNMSKYDYYDDGAKGRILEYTFHKNRLHESTIFKIPETAKGQVLTYTNVKSPHDEFYTAYLESGFTGLSFDLIYSEG